MYNKSLSLKARITFATAVILVVAFGGYLSLNFFIQSKKDSATDRTISHIYNNVIVDNEHFHITKGGKSLAKVSRLDFLGDFFSGKDLKNNTLVIKGMYLSIERSCNASGLYMLDKDYKCLLSTGNRVSNEIPDKFFKSESVKKLCLKSLESWDNEGGMVEINGIPELLIVTSIFNDNDDILGYAVITILPEFITRTLEVKTNSFVAFQMEDGTFTGAKDTIVYNSKLQNKLSALKSNTSNILKVASGVYLYHALDVKDNNDNVITKCLISFDYNKEHRAINKLKQLQYLIIIAIIIGSLIIIDRLLFNVLKPLGRIVSMLKEISEGKGDLTKRLSGADDKTEIGELARYFNLFIENIQTLIKQSKDNISILSNSSKEQSSISNKVTSSTEEMNSQSASIASAASQASETMDSIASDTEEMSTSVSAVATAIEEMSSTVNEISKNCQNELEISNTANNQAKSTTEMMKKLEVSANEIGKVLDVIKDIADQTNLLALNATIEAASAGEAGKGFAVVAAEVKTLAKQTALATDEIGKQIEDMRTNTTHSVKAIDDISIIIKDVNTISQTIVSAVEEQSATINEISKSVSSVSATSSDISQKVHVSAKGISEISSTTSGFNESIGEISQGMVFVEKNTKELSNMTEKLSESVDRFVV